MTQALELRVLIGLHRAARCAVHDGATIGSDPECDIVLTDEGIAPRAGRIRLKEQGWLLDTDDATPDGMATIPWNHGTSIGKAWIAIAPCDAPWITPDLDDAAAQVRAQHSAMHDRVGSGPRDSGVTNRPFPERKRSRAWPVQLGLGAVGLAILTAVALIPLSTATIAPQKTSRQTQAEQSLGKISAALERLGLASSLHVTLSKAGSVSVSGWVRDKAQYEATAIALSRIWPMPAMRISIESDAILTARSILQRFSVKYDPLYQGNGRLEIVGVATSARERVAALDAVRAQLSGMTVLGNNIELAQELSERLSEKLVSLGLSGVTLVWKAGHLEILPPAFDDAREKQLDTVVDEFNKKYWNIAQLGSAKPETVADSVPFAIRSVIGGPQPFIVLADGSKILVGGMHKKYKLIAVEDKRLIFDGPRRAIVTR
ncbi:type III secretion system inner membrane ring subunit SctD [Bordetella tumulicola]|uniref:type III secretion system inner membrane ring subunit SctD n=1 Tax=Bordetella tumulicola TaxID=1649133 RepID=UPI0039F0BD37